jgi:hypothetical protein
MKARERGAGRQLRGLVLEAEVVDPRQFPLDGAMYCSATWRYATWHDAG